MEQDELIYRSIQERLIVQCGYKTTKVINGNGGMILLVTDGIGYYQIEGEPVQIMYPGDVAFCPPGVKHWHGGSKDTKFAHIAVNTNPELKGLEWYDRISDEEYAALTTEKPAEAETETSGK